MTRNVVPVDTLRSVEAFFAEEADLLDEWKLNEWFALFTSEARYVVTSQGDLGQLQENTMPLINDGTGKLHERVSHLVKGQAWAERPRSRTRRLISNIRLGEANNTLQARANFVVYQFRNGESWEFVGTCLYHLVPEAGSYRIASKFVRLDQDVMTAQRRISIII